MNNYRFKARKQDGSLLTGNVEAQNRADATKQLLLKNLVPVEITEVKPETLSLDFLEKNAKIGLKDLAVFFKQLHAVFAAGIPIADALNLLSQQTGNKNLRKITVAVKRDVEGGESMSIAFSKHPKAFSHLVISMIRSGEKGGELEATLDRIAGFIEKEHKFQQTIKAALRYPTIVVTAISIAFVACVTFVIPKFTVVFSAFKSELPLPTRILLGANFVLTNYWHIMIVSGLAAFLALKYYFANQGKMLFDTYMLKAPIFGKLLTKVSLARFFKVLADLLSSGVPVADALEVASATSDNVYLSSVIMAIRKSVLGGEPLSVALAVHPVFPVLGAQMIRVGEKSGNLSEMLVKTAVYFENDADDLLGNLSSMIEPVLILVLGAFVLLLALGIFMPMWNMFSLYMK